MTFKTQGIILRHFDVQEHHRLYTFLTKERGKIRAIARGVKKIKSKQNSKLKPFSIIELMIANGRRIDTMATADTVKDFPNIKNNLLVLGLASLCLEITDALLQEGERDIKVYRLLEEVISVLDAHHSASSEALRLFSWVYALRLIDYLGYGPDLFRCISCQNELAGQFRLEPGLGGLICGRHPGQEDVLDIAPEDMGMLRQLESIQLSDFWKLKLSPETAKKYALYLKSLVRVHVDRPLKSERFVERI